MKRALLLGGVVGPVVFVVAFLIEGATRADYDPIRQPVSSLALGPFGWTQVTNFVVTGVLVLAFAFGLWPAIRRFGGGRAVPILIGLVGVGLIGAGIFSTEPISGYPPGTPPLLAAGDRSLPGILHDLFSTPVFTALPAACCALAYRFSKLGHRWWARYSLVSGVAFLLLFVMTSLGFQQAPVFAPVGGLLQRITLVLGFAWMAALAWFFFITPNRSPNTVTIGTRL